MACHQIQSDYVAAATGALETKPFWLLFWANQDELARLQFGAGIDRGFQMDRAGKYLASFACPPPSADRVEEPEEKPSHQMFALPSEPKKVTSVAPPPMFRLLAHALRLRSDAICTSAAFVEQGYNLGRATLVAHESGQPMEQFADRQGSNGCCEQDDGGLIDR